MEACPYHTYRVRQSRRREGGVIAIDRVEDRIKWVGARLMKRAIEIVCVGTSQRYRATGLPER